MKILIAGATGLVGQEITRLCHERGDVVHYLTTGKSKIQQEENYKGFYWNPNKRRIDTACFEDVEAIINLSGFSISKRWTKQNKKRILNSRIRSLQLLNASLSKTKHGVKAFASASAIGIYPHSYTNYYDETFDGVDSSFVGDVVEKWEKEASLLNEDHKFPVAIIRTGLILSSKGGAIPKMIKPLKNYLGAVMGSGDQWQSWIHVSDIAHIYLHCIDNQLSGVYNAVAPNPVTHAKLTHEMAHALGKPIVLPNIPIAILKLLLGEMAYLLYSSQRVSAKKIARSGYHFHFSNMVPALKDVLNKKSQFHEELA